MAAEDVAEGKIDVQLEVSSTDELGHLAESFNRMTDSLRMAKQYSDTENWIKTGQNRLAEIMRGDHDVITLARNVITYLCKYIGARVGAVYLVEGGQSELRLVGSYAFLSRKNVQTKIKVGEGLVGQAAFERETIVLTDVPEDYVRVVSGLGEDKPRNIVVIPFEFEGELQGVMELGTLFSLGEREVALLIR